MKYLTKRATRTWLQALPPGTFVGRSNSATRCPLARCLLHLNGLTPAEGGSQRELHQTPLPEDLRPWITTTHYVLPAPAGTGLPHPTPRWAARFITSLDRDLYGPITARQALTLLDALTKHTAAQPQVKEKSTRLPQAQAPPLARRKKQTRLEPTR